MASTSNKKRREKGERRCRSREIQDGRVEENGRENEKRIVEKSEEGEGKEGKGRGRKKWRRKREKYRGAEATRGKTIEASKAEGKRTNAAR